MRKWLVSGMFVFLSVTLAAAELLPLKLGPQWKAFISNELEESNAAEINNGTNEITLPGGTVLTARAVTMKDYYVNLNDVIGSKQPDNCRAILVNTIEAERDGTVRLGLGVDWWFDCYVNGKLVYSTGGVGNVAFPITPDNHTVDVKVRKGQNTIALFVISGSNSWGVACGPPSPASQARNAVPETVNSLDNVQFTDQMSAGPNPLSDPLRIKYLLFRKGAAPKITKIIGGPWLQWPNPGTMTVSFVTFGDTPAGVDYREKGQEQWTRQWNMLGGQLRNDLDNHNITLTGLKENTVYEYRPVLLEPRTNKPLPGAEIYSFTSFTSKPKEHRFFATGDIQFPAQVRTNIIRRFLQNGEVMKSDFFVTLGDSADSVHELVDTLFFGLLNPLFEQTAHGKPYIPLRGNHEYRGNESSSWFKIFGSAYRGFRYGDTYYIVLDSGDDQVSKPFTPHFTATTIDTENYMRQQAEWLSEIVKTPEFTTAKFRIVLCHSAPFGHNGEYMRNAIRKIIDPHFGGENPKHRIHLWLSGHIHVYRRTIPGTNEIKALAPIKSKSSVDGKNYRFPVVAIDGPRGGGHEISGLIVKVGSDEIDVESIDINNNTFDHFSVDKDGKFKELGSVPELKTYEMPRN